MTTPPPPMDPRMWAHQQMLQREWAANADRQRWLAATRPVGLVLGIGVLILALARLTLIPLWLSPSASSYDSLAVTLALRGPMIGAVLGGAVIAAGWLVVLAHQPRPLQRLIGVSGVISGGAIFAIGIGAVTGTAADALSWIGWIELSSAALAALGATSWRGEAVSPLIVTGWVGIGLCVALRFVGATLGFAAFGFGLVPLATWVVIGVAAMGMRAVRSDLPAGVPAAVLVQR